MKIQPLPSLKSNTIYHIQIRGFKSGLGHINIEFKSIELFEHNMEVYLEPEGGNEDEKTWLGVRLSGPTRIISQKGRIIYRYHIKQ